MTVVRKDGRIAKVGYRYAIFRDPRYAPCGFLICRKLKHAQWNTRDDENTVLIQTEWDFPGVASGLGFVLCECGVTDGTVDCAHKTAAQMISAAYDFLVEHQGETFDGSEYFSGR